MAPVIASYKRSSGFSCTFASSASNNAYISDWLTPLGLQLFSKSDQSLLGDRGMQCLRDAGRERWMRHGSTYGANGWPVCRRNGPGEYSSSEVGAVGSTGLLGPSVATPRSPRMKTDRSDRKDARNARARCLLVVR